MPTLEWTDNATDEDGFTVERKSEAGALSALSFTTLATRPASTGTGLVTYLDATTTPGVTYCYRVSAFNGNGASAPTNTAEWTEPALPAGVRLIYHRP